MRKKKKKLEKKYVILIILLIISAFIGLSINVIRTDRKLTLPEKLIKDSILFINQIISKPAILIKEQIEKSISKNNIYEKYRELEEEKEAIERINALNEELNEEIKQLKKALELNNTLSENSYLNATVINRNLDYFSNTLTIDKGEKNGVVVGMAVIVNKGLIGKVINTTHFNSTVKLLTSDDINNKVSVKIKNDDNYIYGLLVGYDILNGYLIIEGIDSNETIEKDSVVTTTGLGGVFPSGILVGKVVDTKKDNFDLATTVLIKSEVDFDNINFVTILKRNSE